MLSSNRTLRFFVATIGFILLTLLVDTYLMKGAFDVPFSDSPATWSDETDITLYPFRFSSNTSTSELNFSKGYIYSHVIGLGVYEKIVSVSAETVGAIDFLSIRMLQGLKIPDGASDKEWVRLEQRGSGFFSISDINSPFVQLKAKINPRLFSPLEKIVVRVKDPDPPGSINLFRHNISFSSAFQESPLVKISMDDSFSTCEKVNRVNGKGINIIAVLDLASLRISEVNSIIKYYSPVIKVWNLVNTSNRNRGFMEAVVSNVFRAAPDTVLFWESDGVTTVLNGDGLTFPGAPDIKLNRGTIWTALLVFVFLFLMHGTRRVFRISLLFHPLDFLREGKWFFLCMLVFSAPLFFSGFVLPTFQRAMQVLLITAAFSFIAEFLRAILLRTFPLFFERNEKTGGKSWVLILTASLLISGLYAGYPGFEGINGFLLILANFLTGLYLGRLLVHKKTLGLPFVIHFAASLPMLILIGL